LAPAACTIMIVKATLYSKCVTIVALALARSLNYDRRGMMQIEVQKRLYSQDKLL
jgi:hypothetical protein